MQTHPFGDERVRSAEARKGHLVDRPAQALGGRVPQAHAGHSEQLPAAQEAPEPEVAFLKRAMLTAWPTGQLADGLRLEKLHRRRDDELTRPLLSRDYGAVVKTYRTELADLKSLDPKGKPGAVMEGEITDLETKRKELYPRALETLGGGIYESSFLVAFLSNFPDSPKVPEVALAQGDANRAAWVTARTP